MNLLGFQQKFREVAEALDVGKAESSRSHLGMEGLPQAQVWTVRWAAESRSAALQSGSRFPQKQESGETFASTQTQKFLTAFLPLFTKSREWWLETLLIFFFRE